MITPHLHLKLPEPVAASRCTLDEALERRRSVREFSPAEIADEAISRLAWAAQGVTDGGRTAPSAGALYPLSLYVARADGAFVYRPDDHALEPAVDRDVRGDLARASLDQEFVGAAPVIFVIAADYEIVHSRYGGRARRYAHLEAGHAAQNLLLEATALGLGAVPIGAFDDERVAELLEMASEEAPLYVVPVGTPAA